MGIHQIGRHASKNDTQSRNKRLKLNCKNQSLQRFYTQCILTWPYVLSTFSSPSLSLSIPTSVVLLRSYMLSFMSLFVSVCFYVWDDDTNSTNKTATTEIIIFTAHLFCTDLKTVWIILTNCTMFVHVHLMLNKEEGESLNEDKKNNIN